MILSLDLVLFFRLMHDFSLCGIFDKVVSDVAFMVHMSP
jgi:hypothetical protein